MEFQHVSVLLQESIEGLNIKPNGIYVDGTAGGAGHSSQIARRLDPQQGGRLISIDKDPDAIQTATQRLSPYPAAQVVRGDFKDIPQILDTLGIDRVDGILLDLGVSSRQLDTAQRGFSYHFDSRLDMRMSQQGLSAYDVVNSYSKEELIRILRDYGEEKFAPRIAAALAGSFTDADVDSIASIFAAMPAAGSAAPERAEYTPCMALREKAVEQNQLVIGFPGLKTASDGRFAMQLFSSILGGSSSSRLFQTVREKNGLCYSIYSFTAGYEDTGLFAVALAANRQSEERALRLTVDELRHIRDGGVTAAELDRAREQVTASILMSLESSASRMNRLGYGELFLGGALTPDELIARYEAVTLGDVRDIAGRTLDFRRASLSAVGRVSAEEKYRELLLSGEK